MCCTMYKRWQLKITIIKANPTPFLYTFRRLQTSNSNPCPNSNWSVESTSLPGNSAEGGAILSIRGSPMTSVADARCLESIRRARQTDSQTDEHMFCDSTATLRSVGWGWDTTITGRLASDGSWHAETVNLFSSSWQKRFDLRVPRSGS